MDGVNAMNPDERKNLAYIVGRYAELNRELQERKWEQKELADSAWEKCGMKPKEIKQLAREQAWDDVKREEQRQHEERLDRCRAALGMLSGTPLGDAELERVEAEKAQSKISKPSKRAGRNGKGAGAHV